MNQVNKLIDHIKLSDRCSSWQSSSFRFLCPYCQTGQKDSKGRLYTSSKAKGYIFKINKDNYDLWVFKCHKSGCSSGKSITIDKLIKDHYPNLLSDDQIEELIKEKVKSSNPAGRFNKKPVDSKPTQNQDNSKLTVDPQEPTVQKLPRLTPQQQSGKGSILQKRLQNKKRKSTKWWEDNLPSAL